ncbi:MAG: hypothetical protein ACQEP3_01765 [Patescibacteria group bacterium]
MAKLKSKNEVFLQRLKHHLHRNNQITKEIARNIAKDCDLSFAKVKRFIIKVKKRMTTIRNNGYSGSNFELINLAISQLREDI